MFSVPQPMNSRRDVDCPNIPQGYIPHANAVEGTQYELLALRRDFESSFGLWGEESEENHNLVNVGCWRILRGKKNMSRIPHKKNERTTRQPGHQHIEAHIVFHRASRTHQTASTALKHSPEEAARFVEDALRDFPRQTC